MLRLAAVLALTLVAAGLGGAGAENVAVAQTPAKASAVLALVEAYNGSRLVWLDPATLRPLERRSVALPGGAWGPVFSPAGRYVALGGPGSVGIRIVDLRRMKLVARVVQRSSYRRVTPLAWPERRRLLALDSPTDAEGATDALLAIDPVERRIVARTVRASEEGDGSLPRARVARPALAVDPAGRRAFVIDSMTVAQVDLDTLETSYARLAESRSFAFRFLAWLDPAAHAKLVSGFSRQATWLGDGSVAVSGASYEGTQWTPSGLQLVDTQTGAVRTLEPRASAHRFSQGILHAFGTGRDGATNVWAGTGLSAFTPDGARLWSALGDEPVGWVEIAGGYAYVLTPESFPQGVRVIDLATGDALRTVRGDLPTFVTRD